MNKPTGKYLLSLLVELLAEQEHVKIEYEIKEKEHEEVVE